MPLAVGTLFADEIKMGLEEFLETDGHGIFFRSIDLDLDLHTLGQAERHQAEHRPRVGAAVFTSNFDAAGIVADGADDQGGGAAMDAVFILYRRLDLDHGLGV